MLKDYQEDYPYSDFIVLNEKENRELEQWLRNYYLGK
jgi:hypothetical protein